MPTHQSWQAKFPCLSTESVLSKASKKLKSEISKVKILEITRMNNAKISDQQRKQIVDRILAGNLNMDVATSDEANFMLGCKKPFSYEQQDEQEIGTYSSICISEVSEEDTSEDLKLVEHLDIGEINQQNMVRRIRNDKKQSLV